jgi:hypothetical protein
LRHSRCVRLADRPHLSGLRHRKFDDPHECDSARSHGRSDFGKSPWRLLVDTETGKTYEARAKAIVVAASTLESARLLLLSES